MSEDNSNTLGNLNGWQVFMFRINLIVLPILLVAILSLGTWLVSQVSSLHNLATILQTNQTVILNNYYSAAEARAGLLEERQYILNEVASKYPPKHWTERIDNAKMTVESLERRVTALERGTPN